MADIETHMSVSKKRNPVKLKYTTFVANDNSKTKKDGDEEVSLQEAFKKYRKAKQKQLKQARRLRRRNELRKADPKVMAALRRKFVQQAKKYFGYPYAKKYWPPDSEEYHSKLFLDCCGLVRQVMRDLADDFGFVIGPWNQAYMYDTLPITIKREEDMKPGDLVFISATYFNPKSKKQPHNMTHVEIWLGDGPKTIGARWNNGKVQVFDHYKFTAKSYYDETYHFKSIDTWLKGICRSHCTQHGWKRRKFNPRKKSVFSIDQQQTSDQNDQQDQAAGDDLDDITNFIMRGNSFYSERDSPNKASLMCPQKDQVGDQKPDSEDEKEGSASSVSMASSVVEATSPDITDGNKELLVEDNDDGGNVEECEDIQDEDNNDLESTSDNLEDDMDFIDAGDADDEEIEGDRPLGMDSGQLVEPDMGSKIGKSGKLVDFDNRGIYLRDLLTNGEANQSTPVCNDGIESPDAVDNCSICQDQIAVDKCDDKLTENIRKDTPSIHRETDTNCYKDRNDSKTKDVFQEVVQGIVKNNSTEDLESINRNQNALRKSEKNHQEQLGSSPTISSRLSPESSISYASIASFVAERKGAQSTESEDNLAGSMSSLSVQDESKGAC